MAADTDRRMMLRAIAAGRTSLGKAWPNPAVGCVIAAGKTVVGEGATGAGGRPHAEELALDAAGRRAAGAVAYVTLEPCAERSSGAPSCSDRLIAAGVSRVVIACEDPTPLASAQGLQRLRAAGIEVEVGLLADEAAPLSEGFVNRVRTGRPLVFAAPGPEGFDGTFALDEGEGLAAALERLGTLGMTRLWVGEGSALAARLRAQGLLQPKSSTGARLSRTPGEGDRA